MDVPKVLTSSRFHVRRRRAAFGSRLSGARGLSSTGRPLISGALVCTTGGIFRKFRLSSKTRSTSCIKRKYLRYNNGLVAGFMLMQTHNLHNGHNTTKIYFCDLNTVHDVTIPCVFDHCVEESDASLKLNWGFHKLKHSHRDTHTLPGIDKLSQEYTHSHRNIHTF